jgi:hypothetical protein
MPSLCRPRPTFTKTWTSRLITAFYLFINFLVLGSRSLTSAEDLERLNDQRPSTGSVRFPLEETYTTMRSLVLMPDAQRSMLSRIFDSKFLRVKLRSVRLFCLVFLFFLETCAYVRATPWDDICTPVMDDLDDNIVRF